MKRIVFFAVLGLLMACQKDVPVTAILLNKTDIILKEGENAQGASVALARCCLCGWYHRIVPYAS